MFIPALLLVSLAAPAAPAIQSATIAQSAPTESSTQDSGQIYKGDKPAKKGKRAKVVQPEQVAPPTDAPRVWLGLSVRTVGEDVQDGSERQLEIGAVVAGSPAADAGLRDGDRLTAVDGEHVASHEQLIGHLRSLDPGAELRVTLRRKLEAELDSGQVQGSSNDQHVRLGVSLGDIKDQSELRDARIQITSVVKGSPAEKAGVKAGDELISIDGDTFDSTDDVVARIGEHHSGDRVQMWVERTLRVRVAERPGSASLERETPRDNMPEGTTPPTPPSTPFGVVPRGQAPQTVPQTPPMPRGKPRFFVPRPTPPTAPRPTPRDDNGDDNGPGVTADELRQLTSELRQLRQEIAELRDQVSKLEQHH